MALSRNGWPVLKRQPPVNYVAPNGKRVNFANDNAAYILGNFATFLHHKVERLDTHGSSYRGIYSWRKDGIVGSLRPSYHNCAVAFDYNGHLHPFKLTYKGNSYSDGFTTAQEGAIRQEMARLEKVAGRKVIRWGMDFIPIRKDPMHFELAPGMTPSVTARVVAILKSNPEGGSIEWYNGVLKKGQTGRDIQSLKVFFRKVYTTYSNHLNSSEFFDEDLRLVVMEFQARVGLTADGVVGPRTLEWLSKPRYGGWVPKYR